MKLYKQALCALTTALFSASTFAACSPTACSNVYIERLYPQVSGQIFIGTSGDETLLNCVSQAGAYMTLKNGTDGRDAVYSTLLAAFMTNQLVTIRIKEGTPNCEILYMKIDRQ